MGAHGSPADEKPADMLLLYLDGRTWTSGPSSEALAREVLDAIRRHTPLLLVHEMPTASDGADEMCNCCYGADGARDDQSVDGAQVRHSVEFDTFFGTTPRELLRAGLYDHLAVPLKGGAWRKASFALLNEALMRQYATDSSLRGMRRMQERFAALGRGLRRSLSSHEISPDEVEATMLAIGGPRSSEQDGSGTARHGSSLNVDHHPMQHVDHDGSTPLDRETSARAAAVTQLNKASGGSKPELKASSL